MHWRERILRETNSHEYNYFVTLTFSPTHLAGIIGEAHMYSKKEGMKAIEEKGYRHVSLFLKRLRKGRTTRIRDAAPDGSLARERQVFDGLKFRFFAVFELGEKTQRPHFHLLMHFDRWVPPKVIETEWRSRSEAALVNTQDGMATYISKYLAKSDGASRVRASRQYGVTICQPTKPPA